MARIEGVSLSPFSGSIDLENALAKNISLRVISKSHVETLEANESLLMPREEIEMLGLELQIENTTELLSAALQLGDRDNFDVVVLARDGAKSPLKLSQMVYQAPLTKAPAKETLAEVNAYNPGTVLGHGNSARELDVYIVFNKDLVQKSPIKPSKKGSILARISFSIRPEPNTDSPQPLDLTDDTRNQLRLPAGSWIHFEPLDGFLTEDSFSGAFNFYVDKGILDSMSLAESNEREKVEVTIFTHLMSSVVYEASRQFSLSDDSEFSSEEIELGAVGNLLKGLLSEKGDGWLTWLKDNPASAVSFALADKKLQAQMIKGLQGKGESSE